MRTASECGLHPQQGGGDQRPWHRDLPLIDDFTGRLALLEELTGMPFGAVWDYHCLQQGAPVGIAFMDEIRAYEAQELAGRD